MELDGLWSSTCVFLSLFLLSVSYSATITLLKVGPGAWAGGAGGPWASCRPHTPPPQVKRVFSAELRSTPQALHDYANILHPGA